MINRFQQILWAKKIKLDAIFIKKIKIKTFLDLNNELGKSKMS
jgi:hypothetical protein